MSKQSLRRAIAACTLPAAMLSAPALVLAEETIEEVVVTGSFIRGTPQDTALPVDVLSAQDLQDVGNPTITEMIRNLNISNGNIGETNQFNSSGGQGNEGVATINLRGLGSARTLVLINGRRHVSTANVGVDISAIPSIAIGRIEVLKDGAAALYGSDAIAGVTNFITRDNFEGAEFRLSGQTFEESDGEYQAGMIVGGGNDRWHVTGAFEYERRSEVRLGDLDWATPPQSWNPQGGYSSIGNPGTIFPVGVNPATGNVGIIGRVPDPGCEAFGSTLSANTCFFQFTEYDNLVEQQDTYKAFVEANYAVTETIDFHIEGLYSRMEIPKWATSPSYPPQSLFGPDRLVPVTHPGVQDLIAKNPGLLPDATIAVYPLTRHAGAGGYINGEPRRGERETDTYRLATGLDGTLFDGQLGFDVAMSWSKRDRITSTPDMYVERLALALDGLGGPNCDPVTGTPGQGGCLYHTPFSNGLERSFVNGYVNPDVNTDLARMNRELQPWLETDVSAETSYELFVFDATFDGELPIELAGGTVGWAAGIQTRNEQFALTPAAINDLTVNPCPFADPVSVTLGNTDTLDCTQSRFTTDTGLFAFLSGTFAANTERTVYGAFAELGLPLTEKLNAQLAVRFEDYGGNVGSTIDPKLALRYQATEAVTLRGSISTTFRGPPQNFLEGRTTSLQFTAPANAFKAVDTTGNPDLEPETAIASNLGIVFDKGNFFGSLDYWRFDFESPLQVEDFNAVVSAYGTNNCAPGAAGDGSTACNSLQQQVVFQPGSEGVLSQIQRIRINYINGGDITTSGFDWFGQYDFDTRFGSFEVGTQGTYTAEYEVGAFENFRGVFLAAGGDFAGNLNDNRNTITPITDLQGSVFTRFTRDSHRVTLTGRYWGEYEDEGAIPARQTIKEHFTVDVNYNVSLMEDQLGLNLSVFNLFDNLAPKAQTDLNYDPYTHSPFGRMIKVGLTYNL